MGAVLGLLVAVGLLLVHEGLTSPPTPRSSSRRGPLTDLLARGGLDDVTPARLLGSCAGVGASAALVMLVVSRTATIAVVFGLLAAWTPVGLLRRRAARRRAAAVAAWPDVVDDLASAVRAGLSLPEALAAVGERGPEALRPAFSAFAADLAATGRFGDALDRLKDALADPVADRVVESLRLAREVGGHDLGRLLRTLSTFLRDDARLRGEVLARQSWTVSAARLAVAAPWVVLALLSLRPEAVEAYATTTGAIVLVVVAAVSLLAYRVMVAIGRLPEDPRVLA